MKLRTLFAFLAALALSLPAFAESKECQKNCALKCSQNNSACMQKCPKSKTKPGQSSFEPDGQGGYKVDPAMQCQADCGRKVAECAQPCLEKCQKE